MIGTGRYHRARRAFASCAAYWDLEVTAQGTEMICLLTGARWLGRRRMHPTPPVFIFLLLTACDGGAASGLDPDAMPPSPPGCELTDNTASTSTVTGECALLERDTSACEADRRALGLDGFWLRFSCRVSITRPDADTVQLVSDDQPDHPSNYFPVDDPCHEVYRPPGLNPNVLQPKHMTASVPRAPSPSGSAMPLGTVGIAINGVSLYSNVAAPGDDIYSESASFDRCQGHPTGRSAYHYHSEPWSISSDDAAFIGVILDGYPVYGRRDADGTLPALDSAGGHTGPTPDSATPAYHYHVNQQTSTAPGTAGQQVWFITNGQFAGTPGACEGC